MTMTSRLLWTVCPATTLKRKPFCKNKQRCGCVQFDSIKSLKVAELRSVFTGKQVVYVYHNRSTHEATSRTPRMRSLLLAERRSRDSST
jgi:hypothetical protein